MEIPKVKTNIVILGIDIKSAINILESMLFTIDETVIRRTASSFETETRIVRAKKWSTNERGIRAHKLYIDKRIDSDTVRDHLIRYLRPKDIFDSSWIWSEHIRYF